MKRKEIYMIKFSIKKTTGTSDYEYQSSTESYLRIDGEKNHKLRFIGLENIIFEKFVEELEGLKIFNWDKKIDVDHLQEDSWSLLLCSPVDFLFMESSSFDHEYEKIYSLIKKYDLD